MMRVLSHATANAAARVGDLSVATARLEAALKAEATALRLLELEENPFQGGHYVVRP